MHPDLGSLADFRAFVRRANALGIEVALDLALQASPDHPWVAEHPDWFTQLPDGTIRYAENPPKKYQDIYPVNFDDDPEGIYAEVLRIVRHWMKQGVRIFRVDNPHTKPLWFWERLIAAINADDPGVVFLAEAFTRPAMMQALAMVGFQQSYSYFTWRNTKEELEEFLTSVVAGHGRLHASEPVREHPRHPHRVPAVRRAGGVHGARDDRRDRGAALGRVRGLRAVRIVARPGAEEAIDNEKYEYKPRDFAAAEAEGHSLALYLGILNRIRADHPALGQLRNIRFHHSEDDSVLVYTKHLERPVHRRRPRRHDHRRRERRPALRARDDRAPRPRRASASTPARASRSKTS